MEGDTTEDGPPWKQEEASGEVLSRLVRAYPDYQQGGMAYFGPSRYLAVSDSNQFFEQYYRTPVHKEDVWVVTLPKCGTTWTQELVWLVVHDGDLTSAQSMLMPDRWHFLEIAGITSRQVREKIAESCDTVTKDIYFKPIGERQHPWFVKTHLPLHMCPRKLLDTCKVVYVARNPKDACISYFHHLRLFQESSPDLTLEEFVDLFMEGNVSQLPFFPHVLEAWKLRSHPNLLFLFYEDLKSDLRGSILRVAEFFNKKLSDECVLRLEQHLQFDTMKDNKWVNKESTAPWNCSDNSSQLKFMRKGCTGDWKNHFTPEMDSKFQSWMDRELKDTGLTFTIENKRHFSS